MADPQIPSGADVLAVPLPGNDADAENVRDYLLTLLAELWRQAEGFSSKRPLGNSDWQWQVYGGLLDAGMIEGTRDSDGCIHDLDDDAGGRLIQGAILALADATVPDDTHYGLRWPGLDDEIELRQSRRDAEQRAEIHGGAAVVVERSVTYGPWREVTA